MTIKYHKLLGGYIATVPSTYGGKAMLATGTDRLKVLANALSRLVYIKK